ncbi:MAG TPA: SMC-Scp complex subunit ScpB [Candidatus Nanoarchaeia archaeon]|nr:SMC-Scp complex subunit ScpB [Candidatus Nanoarchaeia archaeon]
MTSATTRKTIEEIDEAKEKENLRTLEAVLFVAGRFLTIQEIVSLTDLNPLIIKELIEKLKEDYSKKNTAIEIIEKNKMWKMDVKQDYVYLVNKLATGSSEFTKSEKETLAIIAYKQPIKQSVVIKIRGNKAYDDIKKFVDLGLIEKKKFGHTYELALSDEFYDYFNLDYSENPVESAKKNQEEPTEELEEKDNSKQKEGKENGFS